MRLNKENVAENKVRNKFDSEDDVDSKDHLNFKTKQD